MPTISTLATTVGAVSAAAAAQGATSAAAMAPARRLRAGIGFMV
jgi:hypothetical protein